MNQQIQPAEPNNKLKYLLIGVIILLLCTNGVMIYFYVNNTNEIIDKKKQLKFTTVELLSAKSKVDSMETEIESRIKAYEDLKVANDTLSQNYQDLKDLKAALAKMRSLKRHFEKDAGKAWRLYNDSKDQLMGFKELLEVKDEKIELLKKQMNYLYTEVKELKEEKVMAEGKVDSIRFIEEELKEKVKVASKLEATNIKVSYINLKQKEKDKQPFRGDKIARLKVVFNLPVNKVATVENKKIFLKLEDQNGKLLLNESSGNMAQSEDGKVFTEVKTVMYRRDNQEVEIFFSKGGNYAEGKYTLELYCEGNTIGTGSFEIK